MNLQVIYIAEDGIASLSCGVGVIAQNFVAAFPSIAYRLGLLPDQVCLNLITLTPLDDSPGRRGDLLTKSVTCTSSCGGSVYLIPACASSQEHYFDFPAWRVYNQLAVERVSELVSSFDGETIVISNDGIFGQVVSPSSLATVWIPHSLACVHRQSYTSHEDRIAWERECVQIHLSTPNANIGALSPYAWSLLETQFGIPPARLIRFDNSFFFPLLLENERPEAVIHEELVRRNVPLHKDLIFSFARADEYKGLEIALETMLRFTRQHENYHGVLIAASYSNEAHVRDLQTRLQQIHGGARSVSMFFDLDFQFPKLVLQYIRTRFLLHLPIRDFCPLIPVEAQILGHPALIIVNSSLPCFHGLVTDMLNGFLVDPESDAVLDFLERAERGDIAELAAVLEHARASARHQDMVFHYFSGIETLLSRRHLAIEA